MVLPVTEISITWAPLDSPTAVESADIELKEAQTDVALKASTGAIDGLDIRKNWPSNKESSYYGIEVNEADYVEANTSTNEASAMGNFASSGHEGETSAVFSRPSYRSRYQGDMSRLINAMIKDYEKSV